MTLRRAMAWLVLRRSTMYMTEIAQVNITAANVRSTIRADALIVRKPQLITLDNGLAADASRIIGSAGIA
jgi:hypothetical protein